VARAAEVGARFRARLERVESPLVREVRGRGLMLGVDLRVRPQPVVRAMEGAGFLVLPAGRTAVRFLPPLTIDAADLDAAAEAFERALAEVPRDG
jgi:LysW-gamma-L-lysine/LysW-L-ornithine aminotransferase